MEINNNGMEIKRTGMEIRIRTNEIKMYRWGQWIMDKGPIEMKTKTK